MIHADKHGFLAIQPDDEERLLEAARFLDSQECRTMIAAAKDCTGLSPDELLQKLDEAAGRYTRAVKEKYARQGEF